MYPQSMFFSKTKEKVTFFQQKNVIFTALKIAVYCLGLRNADK